MTPIVSVVMPAYNHARFVGQAVRSVLDQSLRDIELVITDDGSTDGTPDVIRQFDDPRIDLQVFEKNRGAVVAENAGIKRSRGEFIAILNSDDYFLPGKLQKQVGFLRSYPDIAAVFGMPRPVNELDVPLPGLGPFQLPFKHPRPTRREWLRHFFLAGNCLCHPTVMIRRSALDECGLYDRRFANLPDFEMWVRLSLRHNIRVLNDELTGFRILRNAQNASATTPQERRRFHFETFEILKHYLSLSLDELRAVFAPDIQRLQLEGLESSALLLAEIATKGPTRAHHLFALHTMFEALEKTDADCLHLFDLSAKLNPFGL